MSRAERRAIAAISMTAGVRLKLQEHYTDLPGRKTIKALLQRMHDACETAFGEYDENLSVKQVNDLHKKLAQVERACFGDAREQCAVTMLSLSLGALNDIYDLTKHPMRRAVLDALLQATLKVLNYYDRRLSRFKEYAMATKGLAVWEREMVV